jgi:DNA invertase Pin-like site-specific DNA recombinase
MKIKKEKNKLNLNRDYINAPKYGNSLKTALDINPNGFDEETIAQFLGVSLSTVKKIKNKAIEKIRRIVLKQ